MDSAGPIGFEHIESAPHDGSFVRLRFRPALWMPEDHEVIARWQAHAEMPAGGWWFTPDGGYVSPGPLFWTRFACPEDRDEPCRNAWCCMADACLVREPQFTAADGRKS